MIQIGSEVGRKVVSHAVKVLEGFEKRRRLLVHRFDAHHGAGSPRNILRKFDHSLFDDGECSWR